MEYGFFPAALNLVLRPIMCSWFPLKRIVGRDLAFSRAGVHLVVLEVFPLPQNPAACVYLGLPAFWMRYTAAIPIDSCRRKHELDVTQVVMRF
jgi:hypothetical protein